MIKAQGRMIRKTISESPSFAVLSERAQVLFCLLIPHYSAHGKQNGNPYTVKGIVCPKIEYFTIPVITKCLEEISAKTDVKWYEIDGTKYIHSINFDNHQDLREDRMGPDTIPDCPDNLRTTPGLLPDNSSYKIKVKVKEKVKDNEKDIYLDFVLLTKEEHQKLIDRLGENGTADMIERLNNYGHQKPKKFKEYASHYHTILNWIGKDQTDGKNILSRSARVVAGKDHTRGVSALPGRTAAEELERLRNKRDKISVSDKQLNAGEVLGKDL